MARLLSLFLALLSLQFTNANADNGASPQQPADVVGRDLATSFPLLGYAGHVGIYDGQAVIEANNVVPNAVQRVSFSDFKSASTRYWGAAHAPVDLDSFSYRDCETYLCTPMVLYSLRQAIAQRARRVVSIGADYVVTIAMVRAQEFCPGGGVDTCPVSGLTPVRGRYRCDTFVKDTFMDPRARRLTLAFPQPVILPYSYASWTGDSLAPATTPRLVFSAFTERGSGVVPSPTDPCARNPRLCR